MKNVIRALLLSLVFLGSSPAFASLPDNAEEIKTHLEYMGYEVSLDKERIAAKHPSQPNIILIKQQSGLLGMTYFSASEYGLKNRDKLIAIANDLNANSLAVRYYINKDGNLMIVGFYPGSYSKQSFSLFIESYQLLRKQITARHAEIKIYFK